MQRQKLFGEILIDNKMITPAQLEEALELQQRSPYQTVGRFLVQLGYARDADLQALLDSHSKRQSLADILIKHKLVSEDDLQLAMAMSQQEKTPLAKVLLNLEFVSSETLARAKAYYYDMPFVNLEEISIPFRPAMVNAVKAQYAKQHKLLPISIKDDVLTLAVAQPLKNNEVDLLEKMTKLRIRMVIASEPQVLLLQESLYSPGKKNSQVFEGATLVADATINDLIESESESTDDFSENSQVTDKDTVLVRMVNQIIHDAYMSKASDIHIEPYQGKQDVIVRTRIDGRCEVYQRIPAKYKHALVSRIKIMASLDISEKRKPQDGKINFRKFGSLDIELRVATMPTSGGLEDVVIRLLHSGKVIEFEKLGLSKNNQREFRGALKKPYGLILVVGPTGSGKTTTLHSGLTELNTPQVKIWTAEDPIEISQDGLRQVQVNPKIDFNFATALRSFLRLDPDIIMVGEIRDKETAAVAVEASLTGHLVLSTLHTNSAPETITRLLDLGLDPFSFSDSLLMVMAQRLGRKLCSNCKEIYTPKEDELNDLIEEYGIEAFTQSCIDPASIQIGRAVGCELCLDSGYSGRVGVHESLVGTDVVKEMIRKRCNTSELRKYASQNGMVSLKQDGMQKVFQAVTDIHEIRRICL